MYTESDQMEFFKVAGYIILSKENKIIDESNSITN